MIKQRCENVLNLCMYVCRFRQSPCLCAFILDNIYMHTYPPFLQVYFIMNEFINYKRVRWKVVVTFIFKKQSGTCACAFRPFLDSLLVLMELQNIFAFGREK